MEMKPSARELEKFADKIIFTDGNNHNFDFKTLKFESSIWKL